MDLPLAMGADLRGCRKALERIADAIERACAPEVEPAIAPVSSAPPVCLHPEDRRIDFGTGDDGQPDFQCRVCGFRSHPPEEAAGG